MANKVSANITLDSELKKQAMELFSDLGIDLSTAVTLFLKQAVINQGIPFPIARNPGKDASSCLPNNGGPMVKKEEDD